MRPSPRLRSFNFNMDPQIHDRIETASQSIDLSKTTFMNAVLAGAFARGIAEVLATEAIDKGLIPAKRYPRSTKWVSAGEGAYMRDDAHAYLLTRVGHGGRVEPEGNGWYIEGPGVQSTFVGRIVREAQESADAIVDRALARNREQADEARRIFAPMHAAEADAPLVTKSGKVLTDADIEALANEAERGYDVEHLRDKPDRRQP